MLQELQKITNSKLSDPEKFENIGIDDLTANYISVGCCIEENKFEDQAKKLINHERKMVRDSEISKDKERQLKKAIRKDLRQYDTKMIQNAIDNIMNMRAINPPRSRGRQKVL
ncbi:hypothetical protein HHI36_020354 [Cryptolaemus montrouzieri]|uniref:Uncharacterized protein n=1 Tax=Cryptolaemus montrouzieri TaxID=559131 RepID=A0ABD2NA05_9CUCU